MIDNPHIIDIADYIYANPTMKSGEIIAVFCGKLRKSQRTVEGYLKSAKELNRKRLQKQESAKEVAMEQIAEIAVSKAWHNREAGLEILYNIASGKVRKVADEYKVPSDADRVNAVKEWYKVQDWYPKEAAAATAAVVTNAFNIEVVNEQAAKNLQKL
jgi:hypothetical protein